jgi:hypothetical protein
MGITNGGFETGDFTGWTIYTWGSSGSCDISDSIVHSGDYSCRLYLTDDSSDRAVRLSQIINYTTLTEVGVWINIPESMPNATLRIANDSNTTVWSSEWEESESFDWTYIRFDPTSNGYLTGNRSITFELRSSSPHTGAVEAYIDDVHNPLENGTFETGDLTGWSAATDDNCIVEVIAGASQSGSYGCRMYSEGVVEDGTIYWASATQDIDLTDQNFLAISYNIDDYDYGSAASYIYIRIYLEGDGIWEQIFWEAYGHQYEDELPSGWQKIQYDVSELSGIATLTISIGTQYEYNPS